MIIDCISDLHGYYPQLEGGDLLIIAGDLTKRDHPIEHLDFIDWCRYLPYRKIIVIAGNHDNFIQTLKSKYFAMPVYHDHCEYLCDSGIEFEGLKIWGSPWSKTFQGMNPKCKAFTVDTEEDLASKFSLIPEDTDILITHTPPYGILDGIPLEDGSEYHTGSTALLDALDRIKPKLLVFGHIHEQGGKKILFKHHGPNTVCVNTSYVNANYQPVNKPIRIIL